MNGGTNYSAFYLSFNAEAFSLGLG